MKINKQIKKINKFLYFQNMYGENYLNNNMTI